MRHTIKLDVCHSIQIEPVHPYGDAATAVRVSLCTGLVPVISKALTPEHAAALIFALEQALEELQTAAGREAAQRKCPNRAAGGPADCVNGVCLCGGFGV